MAADGGPRQARGAVRRQLPPDRLRAVEHGERRAAPHLRAHAVQVALAGPPHLPDLAPVRRARAVHHDRACPAAARPPLVHRQRGRDLPEPEPDLRRATGLHRGLRCGPRLPDGPGPDDRRARRERRGGHGRRNPGAARWRRREFGCIAADPAGRITEFLEKPRDPPSVPDDPRSPSRRWATTSSPPRCCSTCWRPTPRTATAITTWAATSSRAWSRRARRASTTSPTNVVPGATERDAGYWRDVGTIDAYYEAHTRPRVRAPDLQPVQPALADPHAASAALPPAKFVEGGIAQDSIVGAGRSSPGAIVRRSVISPNVRIDAGAEVSDSVVMPGVRVGRGRVVRGAILDKNVVMPDGALVGVDFATRPGALHRQPGRRSWCWARASPLQ